MSGRRGLGRGIEALIPASSDDATEAGLREIAGAHIAEISTEAIRPNPRQPRRDFDPDEMAELVHSIRQIGLLQPIVVRPIGETRTSETEDGNRSAEYELIMGERRWRASQQAGSTTIGAIIRETSDADMLRDALLENLHRSELNPLEEASAYEQLLQDFGCSHEELAQRLGRSRPQISNTLRLLRLTPDVQRRVAAGVLSAGHARALLGVDEPDVQDRLASRVVAEGLSVRALEEIVTMGPEKQPEPQQKKPTIDAPHVDDVAVRLSERLDTRVNVNLGKTKGKIVVEFATIDDLERIVHRIDPGGAQGTESAPQTRPPEDL